MNIAYISSFLILVLVVNRFFGLEVLSLFLFIVIASVILFNYQKIGGILK
jgi:antibiotic biosynthesis monooxygenase (ABM) superfamily enzyme